MSPHCLCFPAHSLSVCLSASSTNPVPHLRLSPPSSSFSQAAFSILFPFHSFLFCPYPTTPALVSVLGLWPLKSMIQVLWQVSGKPCASSVPPHRFYSVHDSLIGGQPIASPALLAPCPYYGEFRKYSCPSSQDDLDLGPRC